MNKLEAIFFLLLLIITTFLIFWIIAAEDAIEWKAMVVARSGQEGGEYLVEAVLTTEEGKTWIAETSQTLPNKKKNSEEKIIIAEGASDDKIEFQKNVATGNIEAIMEEDNVYNLNEPADVDTLVERTIKLDDLLEFMGDSLEKFEVEGGSFVDDAGEILESPF